MGLPGGSDSKESACNTGDPGSISGSGRAPGEGNSNPLQHSCLKKAHGEEPGSLQGFKESDTTEWLSIEHSVYIYMSSHLPVPPFPLPPWYPCICPPPLCLYRCLVSKVIRNIFSRVHTFVLTSHICFSPSALFALRCCFAACSHDRISLHPVSLTSLDCWSSISATLRSSESGNQRKVWQLNPPAPSMAVFACAPAWRSIYDYS